MSVLKCQDLCIGYENKIIQEHLNFEVQKGDYFFIVGENGAGKSTLMKTILGFIKPLDGKIVFSSDINKKEIGYLPQQTSIQKTFPATVKEIVLSGCQSRLGLLPFYKKQDIQRAHDCIVRMGIEEYENTSFKELSGGQQQRVLLARALCAANSVLLLDEPVKGFDSKIRSEMYELVQNLNKEGLTIIMISHDNDAAEKYATNILKLERYRR